MTDTGYVELHCHSYYSLLDGASSPEALVERAAALGYPALALTDHDGLYGAVRFWQAARERGLKPVVGAEITLHNGPPRLAEPIRLPAQSCGTGGHLTLLTEDRRGYANLCRLLSAGQLAGQKGQPKFTVETLAAHASGLICLSGCRQGAIASALLVGDEDGARRSAGHLRDLFGPARFWIELQRHLLPSDARLVAALVDLARRLGVGLVATNNVHYAGRSGQRLHDLLTCIRSHAALPEALAGGLLHPNSEQCLKSAQEMAALFADLPEAVTNTLRIAGRCDVSLDFSGQRLPAFPVSQGHTPESYLRHLCKAGLCRKFDPATPQAQAQLDHELAVIERAGLAGYFLVVWDIVRFARERGIRCQGRGSAANSLVAYLLGITPVDPLRHSLLFERFLSEGTATMPDIDVDFAADRREEVIQYVYERYGEEHVGMVCNVVTYRARSAVREAAKALAFPPDVIDRAAKALDTHSAAQAAQDLRRDDPMTQIPARGWLPSPPDPPKGDPLTQIPARGWSLSPPDLRRGDPVWSPSPPAPTAPGEGDPIPLGIGLSPVIPWQTLAELLSEMDGVPRHLSIHVGGLLITAAPLVEVVPLERATMPGRVVVQWDKDSVEDAGLIKIDLLCLRTLGMIDEAVAHVKEQQGLTLDLDHLPLDDPAAYDLLCRADTIGCFQVESRAQAQMLPKLQPKCFEDIVVEVALVRPGPIQGGMVHPYLRRRQGLEPVAYAHLALELALAETLGVIVFQEQVIRVAMAVAGFSPAEADRLRRAMSRSRSGEAMAALRERFLSGAQANGIDGVTAETVWEQLAGFAGYGFCKSHAAAFALVAYQTLYLKAHFPAELTCALLNHQPMGYYSPAVIAGDARRHGVEVLRPDANRSRVECTLERDGPALVVRLGLRYVHGLGEAWQGRIVERRGDWPFCDLAGFCRRTRLPKSVVENLIRAGVLDGFGRARPGTRRVLLWELGGLDYPEEGLDLEALVDPVDLPALGQAERMAWEYELLGLTPGSQVMSLYREELRAQGVLSSGELAGRPDGQTVRVAGWVVVRQRPPTAKGHVFITLEDEEGLINLIVRPDVYERYRDALRHTPLLRVEGRLQREGDAMSVLVRRAWS